MICFEDLEDHLCELCEKVVVEAFVLNLLVAAAVKGFLVLNLRLLSVVVRRGLVNHLPAPLPC